MFRCTRGRRQLGSRISPRAKWAEGSPDRTYPDAIEFVLDTIRKNPGQITLVAVAPLTNVGALIAKDPKTFRKLKRVVLMGGSVARGYGNKEEPEAEWNIVNDVAAAKALFGSGVPLYVMPLDSTQILLDAARQAELFGKKTGMTTALEELTAEWSVATHQKSPTVVRCCCCGVCGEAGDLSDHCRCGSRSMTRDLRGGLVVAANANVCLDSKSDDFYALFMRGFRWIWL